MAGVVLLAMAPWWLPAAAKSCRHEHAVAEHMHRLLWGTVTLGRLCGLAAFSGGYKG